MFDTRSGFWLMASIGILAAARHRRRDPLRARRASSTYDSFGAAIGFPMVGDPADHRDPLGHQRVEPAQRADHVHPGAAPRPGDRRQGGRRRRDRRRVDRWSPLGIGALGNVVGTAIAGVDTVWDISLEPGFGLIILANVLGLLIGFMLGVLIRNSAGAIVALLRLRLRAGRARPMLLAETQQWFADLPAVGRLQLRPGRAVRGLDLTGEQWAQPRRHRRCSGWSSRSPSACA